MTRSYILAVFVSILALQFLVTASRQAIAPEAAEPSVGGPDNNDLEEIEADLDVVTSEDTSEERTAELPDVCKSVSEKKQLIYTEDNLMYSISFDAAKDCCGLCRGDVECQAWSFDQKEDICVLLNTFDVVSRYNPTFVSGDKSDGSYPNY